MQYRDYVPGRRLAVIGRAEYGPYLTPTFVASPEELAELFGGELFEAGVRAFEAGASDVLVVRIYDFETPAEAYLALEDAYDVLLPYPADVLLLLPVVYGHVEGPLPGEEESEPARYGSAVYGQSRYGGTISFDQTAHDDLIWQALNFAAMREVQGMPVHVVIQADPPVPPSESDDEWKQALIEWCRSNAPCYQEYVDGSLLDFGRYLSIVLSYGVSDGTAFPGAPSYAGLLVSLEPWTSPMNKSLLGFDGVYPEFTDNEMVELSRFGFVVFERTIRRGIVPHGAVTAADGFYSNAFAVRIRDHILRSVSSSVSSVVGRLKGRIDLDSVIEGTVTSVMEPLVQDEVIRTYSYDFSVDGDEVVITLEAVPAGEVQAVRTDIRRPLNAA